MKLVVTGGAGFLGYHVCNRLADEFDEILILDIAPVDTNEYPANISYLQVDVRDARRLKELCRGVDTIVHAAAALPLWKKNDIFAVNVGGARNVLEAALGNSIKRVVFVSSTAVYGIPKKHPLFEDDELSGVGPYGESKIEAELVCAEYRKKGLCIPIVRPKTFIGSGRLGVFYILYDWIESGKKIPIIGDGNNRYQLLAVDDLVDAIGLLLKQDTEKVNDVFNVGALTFKTVAEDIDELCEYAASGARPMRTHAQTVKAMLFLLEKLKLSPLYQWIYQTADTDSFVSIKKIRQALGWQPNFSNAQALIRSYQWYLDHKHQLAKPGITHRACWRQGVLALFKRFL